MWNNNHKKNTAPRHSGKPGSRDTNIQGNLGENTTNHKTNTNIQQPTNNNKQTANIQGILDENSYWAQNST